MGDRVFFVGLAVFAVAMIALALVWPQGLGRPSPAPFGHPLAPLTTPPPSPAPRPQAVGEQTPRAVPDGGSRPQGKRQA